MLPPQIVTTLIAMTPIGELRAAIPWGISIGGLSSLEAFIFSVLGNITVAILVVLILPLLTKLASKYSKFLDRILQKIFAKTRKKHSQNFLRFEALFLIILVAIPLPGSGAYTGALVAWLFGVRPRVAIPLIAVGVIIAGILVLGAWNGFTAFAGLS